MLGDFPHTFLSDKRITYLHDFTNATNIFPNVEIKSGISYFLWDKDFNGKCQVESTINGKTTVSNRFLLNDYDDIFIRYNTALPIIRKVQSIHETSFKTIVSPQNPFGFNTAIKGNKEKPDDSIIIISKGFTKNYISRKDILIHQDWIDKYKIITPKAAEDGILPGKVLGKINILESGSCCNGTYIIIGPFTNYEHCRNVANYMKTKFFRFLVGMKKMTQDLKDQTFSLVPLQNFDYQWTDKELYEKYNLSDDEISFIESMVKPM